MDTTDIESGNLLLGLRKSLGDLGAFEAQTYQMIPD
jgi:hypothetical protein